jgi:hypothetical protein
MRIKVLLLAIPIVIALLVPGIRAEMSVAYIVADTTSIGGDTMFVDHLKFVLDYEVDLIDHDAVDTFSNWSGMYNGIIISDLAWSSKVVNLKDTSVGIFTMDRYTDNEFGFGNTNYRPSGHGRRLVNKHNIEFVCGTFADTIFPYQYDNKYLYYYGDLAASVIVPFNTPDFIGHDTACVILLDKGAQLAGGGTASERRAFCGVFKQPNEMDQCQGWSLFDRLITWICRDSANQPLFEHQCWSGYLEIDACWGEMTSGQNDSATYNSEFRFGYDGDEIISFWRLNAPEKKQTDGYSCDSMQLLFPITTLGLNGTPADTIMDIRIEVHRIIRHEKWHGPPPNSGGDPYEMDSTWVTRWDVISGSSPVQWDTLDLRSGLDYDAIVLDTFGLSYPKDSVGDTIRFTIPGSVLDLWMSDTSTNNGLVLKAVEVYDSTSNAEYCTRPPIENAIYNAMTVKAWFSAEENVDDINRKNMLSTGIIDRCQTGIVQ